MTLRYYPTSWSQKARIMCDGQVNLINLGLETKAGAMRFFDSPLVGPEIVRNRAVKRFRRMQKKGKVHEDLKLFKELDPIKAQTYELLFDDKL